MAAFPKLIALDLDNTLWRGHLNKDLFRHKAHSNKGIEDNLQCKDGWTVRDVRGNCAVIFSHHAPEIIQTILAYRADIAVVSRNTSKALCDRAMWMLRINFPHQVPFTDFIKYDEVKDEPKEKHFQRIKRWSGFEYHEMLFFDDEYRNATVETNLGVTFQPVPHRTGITFEEFNAGLAVWQRNQTLRAPIPRSPSQNSDCMLVGYVGTDVQTATLYEEGKRRPKSDRPSRWGWGMYLTDDPRIALFFAHWRRENQSPGDERVCCIYARNWYKFLNDLRKVWIQEHPMLMTNNLDPNARDPDKNIMEKEFERDAYIKSVYGVEKPYILFSNHHYMKGMEAYGIPRGSSFNELVIYPQIQDALFIGEAYTPNEVQANSWRQLGYHQKIAEWGIVSR